MKSILSVLALTLSLGANAMDVQLFANINVVETNTVVSSTTSTSGATIPDIDVFASEETFVIGKATNATGQTQQIVAKISGCGLALNRNTLLIRISNKPNIYNGFFSQSTYQLKVANRDECLQMQRSLRQAQFDRIINLTLDSNTKSFKVVR